jgi:phosphatidylglycerophosphatase A
VLVAGFFVGWWACTATARALRVADPSCVVWDEVLAFWLILWIVMPAGWGLQLAAFVLFRLFDAVKVGPVGWADRLFKPRPASPGLGAGLRHPLRRPGGGAVHPAGHGPVAGLRTRWTPC